MAAKRKIESSIEVGKWSFEDVIDALTSPYQKKRRLIVPSFQRHFAWSQAAQDKLIDSMQRGFVVGTVTLYKTDCSGEGVENFCILDGLQRILTMAKYYERPFKFIDFNKEIEINNTKEKLLETITEIKSSTDELKEIHQWFSEWLHGPDPHVPKKSKRIQLMSVHGLKKYKSNLASTFQNYVEAKITDRFDDHVKDEFKAKCITIIENLVHYVTSVTGYSLPVMLYYAPLETLGEVFERLNQRGLYVNKYDIFAAAWQTKTFVIANSRIVDAIADVYNMRNEHLQNAQIEDLKLRQEQLDNGTQVEGDLYPYSRQYTLYEYISGIATILYDRACGLYSFGNGNSSGGNSSYKRRRTQLNIDTQMKIQREATIITLRVFKYMLKRDCIMDLRDCDYTEDMQRQCESSLYEAINLLEQYVAPWVTLDGVTTGIALFQNSTHFAAVIARLAMLLNNEDTQVDIREIAKRIPHYILLEAVVGTWTHPTDSMVRDKLADTTLYTTPISRMQWDAALASMAHSQLMKNEKRRNVSRASLMFLQYLFAALPENPSMCMNPREWQVEHVIPVKRLAEMNVPMNHIGNLTLLTRQLNVSKGSRSLYDYVMQLQQRGLLAPETTNAALKTLEVTCLFVPAACLKETTNNLTVESYMQFINKRSQAMFELFYQINHIF